MSDIAQDLGGVVRLLEKATPGPWTVGRFGSVHRPKVEGSESSVGSAIVVGGSKSSMYDGYQENCEAIAAAVNFLRAHSAEIAGALRDAGTVIRVGNYGAAFDPPGSRRAFTYQHQPGNVDASRLGRAADEASKASAGDSIDRGLALLKALQEMGFGVYQISDSAMQQGGGGGEAAA